MRGRSLVKDNVALSITISRNDICFCGSGSKYKKCCIDKSDEERRLLFNNPENPLVNDWLFYYHPLKMYSAAMIMHDRLAMPGIDELVSNFTKTLITRGEEDAKQIRAEQDPGRLLDKLRRGL